MSTEYADFCFKKDFLLINIGRFKQKFLSVPITDIINGTERKYGRCSNIKLTCILFRSG
jgi:hypothetical protein